MYAYSDQLRSERLLTRWLEKSDAVNLLPFFEDKEATRFLYLDKWGFDAPAGFSAFMVEKQLKRYEDRRFGLQALHLQTGEFIGICGLLAQEVDSKNEVEVGYHLLKEHWGKGYATEAARLFCNYAFDNKITETIISIIDINNIRSQRVAEKNGLLREGQTSWMDSEDVLIYRTHKHLWKFR